MAILVTGGNGFLGTVLVEELVKKGHRVYSLSRHPPEAKENLIPLVGDVTQPGLGLEKVPDNIHAIHHLAGIHRLGEDKDGKIWRTNVDGTRNVLDFCVKNGIGRLFFTSTAYTWECNPYGLSKIKNEVDVIMLSKKLGLKATIFKPSVIMGTEDYPYPGHFMQFVTGLVKVHQRAELIRRKLEGTLRLPVLEPVFKVKGNPHGKLNLVRVDTVAKAMANIDGEGTFWLTNPKPPALKQLMDWVGEFIMVKLEMLPDFKPTPIEAMFQKGASAFGPYLEGDNFPSDLPDHPKIGKAFIEATLNRHFLN